MSTEPGDIAQELTELIDLLKRVSFLEARYLDPKRCRRMGWNLMHEAWIVWSYGEHYHELYNSPSLIEALKVLVKGAR